MEKKEYKDFEIFNQIASDFKEKHKSIEKIRSMLDKETLHSFINVGKLNKNAKEILKSKTDIVRLSLDSLIKNKLHHEELKITDYQKIKDILKSPEKIISTDRTLQMFKMFNDKAYRIIVKSTKDKKENYLTSFHRCDIQKLKR